MMVLKALGIDKYITKKNIFLFITTLILLGMATNSFFELYKMLPSVFMAGNAALDLEYLLLYLFPMIIFIVWIFFYYQKYRQITATASSTSVLASVKPHKGLVFSLSVPENQEALCRKIEVIQKEQIADLYDERSIGQLFKGIYHHREELLYVWPLTTGRSKDFIKCIDAFLKKFMPNVKNNWHVQENLCHLTKEDDFELIEEIKENLSRIFSKDNLQQYACTKSDVIVDITGGTKTISIGNIFGAIDSSIDIQYVEQRTNNIIPLNITPMILFDKIGDFMTELHVAYKKQRGAQNANTP